MNPSTIHWFETPPTEGYLRVITTYVGSKTARVKPDDVGFTHIFGQTEPQYTGQRYHYVCQVVGLTDSDTPARMAFSVDNPATMPTEAVKVEDLGVNS